MFSSLHWRAFNVRYLVRIVNLQFQQTLNTVTKKNRQDFNLEACSNDKNIHSFNYYNLFINKSAATFNILNIRIIK